jgi:hypothetical protein
MDSLTLWREQYDQKIMSGNIKWSLQILCCLLQVLYRISPWKWLYGCFLIFCSPDAVFCIYRTARWHWWNHKLSAERSLIVSSYTYVWNTDGSCSLVMV